MHNAPINDVWTDDRVVSIADARRNRDAHVEELFDAYLKAKAKVDETGRLEDGIAAGKLWRQFLELFTGAL